MSDSFPDRNCVLIADDNALNAEVTAALLEHAGYSVDIASNGQEAVTMAESKEYCALILDCQMPVLDGYEAAHKIRSLNKTNTDVPIIALSGLDNHTNAERFNASGMNDHLTKPVALRELKAVLDKWLS